MHYCGLNCNVLDSDLVSHWKFGPAWVFSRLDHFAGQTLLITEGGGAKSSAAREDSTQDPVPITEAPRMGQPTGNLHREADGGIWPAAGRTYPRTGVLAIVLTLSQNIMTL
jgi:hypothetical protein